MKRIEAAFSRARKEGRGLLSVYLCHGYPDASNAWMDAALAHADGIEFGIPFSDPAADGPVIQEATAEALRNGATVEGALAAAAKLDSEKFVVAMTYANIAFKQGWQRFAAALAAAGVDGLILPDVPLEESGPVREALAAHGVAWIPLVTPTTSAARMAAIAETCTGFLYVVSSVGITGSEAGPLLEETVARARQATDKPILVGFGIRSRADVERVLAAGADGAIVGSHLVALSATSTPAALAQEVARLAMPKGPQDA